MIIINLIFYYLPLMLLLQENDLTKISLQLRQLWSFNPKNKYTYIFFFIYCKFPSVSMSKRRRILTIAAHNWSQFNFLAIYFPMWKELIEVKAKILNFGFILMRFFPPPSMVVRNLIWDALATWWIINIAFYAYMSLFLRSNQKC